MLPLIGGEIISEIQAAVKQKKLAAGGRAKTRDCLHAVRRKSFGLNGVAFRYVHARYACLAIKPRPAYVHLNGENGVD